MKKDEDDECKCCTMMFDRVAAGNCDVDDASLKINRWALQVLSEGQQLKLCRQHFEAVSLLKHVLRSQMNNAGIRNA